jgi:hypothetical protein
VWVKTVWARFNLSTRTNARTEATKHLAGGKVPNGRLAAASAWISDD